MFVKSGRIVMLFFSFIKLVKASNSKISFDIIGGAYASIHDFSFSAYLNVVFRKNESEYVSRCGASVLNQRLLLTAAHCVDDAEVVLAETRVGHANNKYGELHGVDTFAIHEDYNRQPIRHDIAIVRLARELTFKETIMKVALMMDPPPEAAELAGWGLISEEGHRDSRLKWLRQRVIRHQACVNAIGKIPEGMFCTKHSSGYTGSGDSGSALVVRRYIQIGVVSFSRSLDNTISVYANTSYYLPWIQTVTTQLGCFKGQEDGISGLSSVQYLPRLLELDKTGKASKDELGQELELRQPLS